MDAQKKISGSPSPGAESRASFRSLSMELGVALVVSFIIALAFYMVLGTLINVFMQKHFGSEEYYQKYDKELAARFSTFVGQNSIRSDDWYTLRRWAEDNELYQLTVYHERVMIFRYDSNDERENYQKEVSSGQSNHEATNDSAHMETEEIGAKAYEINFADGKCDVILSGSYANTYYLISEILSLLLSLLLFNLLLILSINRKLKYMKDLSRQIRMLIQGDFTTPISLKGNDDLTSMAMDLDALRLSFVQKLKHNEHMQEERRDVITAMSHDMRTPMTPLLVYLQMLADRKYADEEQHDQYVSKSLEKALQLKNLSDNMFSYLLLDKNADIEMVTVSMKEVFYDQLSGMFDYLGENGFTVDADIDMQDVYISVNRDYIYRIFDNLVSNIQKYADPEQYLTVKLYCEHGKVVFHLRNSINYLADYSASTGFGVKNIAKMVSNMSAEFIESKKSDRYDTILLFTIVENENSEAENSEAAEGEADLQK